VLFLSSLVNNITYFYALGHTTVSNAVFTHYTAPLFVAVLAPLLIAERLRRVTLFSLPLAVAGMVMIVSSGGGLQFGKGQGQGVMAGTASGLAYALLIISSRKLSRMRMHHKAVVVVPWVTACVTAVPAFLEQNTLDAPKIGLLLITGILHSTLAPLLYYSALRHVIAQYAAILGYMEPVVAVPLAFLFLSETPAGLALAGGAFILFSGYLVIREKSVGDGQTEKKSS
jgi:drug/metabolite transporter (DMT)-like permease